MAKAKSLGQEPTKSELEILQVLWTGGAATVRAVNEELNKKREVAYSSTLKIMQLMHAKGMLLRDKSEMTHIYFAAIKEEPTKKILLRKFIDALYNGSPSQLMMQLLGDSKKSKKELALLKELVDKLDKDNKK